MSKTARKNRWLPALLLALAVAFVCALNVSASEVVKSGTCGPSGYEKDVEWTLYKDGVLSVKSLSGKKGMGSNPWINESPEFIEQIREVILEPGVTSVVNLAFRTPVYPNLDYVLLSETIDTLGAGAFYGSPVKLVFIPSSLESRPF